MDGKLKLGMRPGGAAALKLGMRPGAIVKLGMRPGVPAAA